MGSIFKRILTVRTFLWHEIFLLVKSCGTIYHNLHDLHINVAITRNAGYVSAGREFGAQAQNFNAKEKHFLHGKLCCLPPRAPRQQLPLHSAREDSSHLPDFQKEVLLLMSMGFISTASGSSETVSVQQEFQQTLCMCECTPPTAFLWRKGITKPREPLLAVIKLLNCTSLSDAHHWGFGKSSQWGTVPTLSFV